MSALRRRGLQIDDPLAPGRATDHGRAAGEPTVTAGVPAVTGPGEEGRRADEAQAAGAVWREWSGLTSVGSFRLPHELLAELGDTARELQLPIGLIVTAAITQLLDQPPDVIAALVDRADDARIHGRRRARRRLTKPSDD